MKYRWLTLGVIVLAVAAISLNRPSAGCGEYYRPDKVISSAGRDIRVEIADSDSEQGIGLSGRSCIGENQGMLFIFERSGYYNFWMKDMNFPIDIVWIDEQKKIIEVTEIVQPSTYPDSFISNQPAIYVLEVKAGRAVELGLSPGLQLSF